MAGPEHITRQQIISVARTRFMRDGYKATSTRKIAQEVGITQPNLYYHFRNKEALYIAVLETVGEEVEHDLSQIKQGSSPDLRNMLIQMTNYLREKHPFNFYIMMHDMKEELSEESRYQLYLIFRKAYQEPFVTLFEEHSQELRADIDPHTIATHYFLVIAPYINPDVLPYRSLTIGQIIDMFLDGVRGITNL